RARDGSEASTVVRELSVGRTDDGRLHSVASGAQGAGVSVGWDLYVDLERRAADGTVRIVEVPLGFVAPLVAFIPFGDAPDGRFSADLRLATRPEGEVEIEGHFEVRDAVIDSPRVSASPVRAVSFAVDGAGIFAPAERTLTWQRGGIRVGEVTVRLGATLTLSDDGFRGSVEATLPPT